MLTKVGFLIDFDLLKLVTSTKDCVTLLWALHIVIKHQFFLHLLLSNGKVLVKNVMKVLLHLYSDDALTEVKQILHAGVSKLHRTDLRKSRKGPNKTVQDKSVN